MPLDSMQELFLNELKDIYNAEKQIVRALPRMAKAAQSVALQRAFTKPLRETEGHVERLEPIFKTLGVAPRGKKCKGMEGLIGEGKEIMEEEGKPEVIDAALVSAATLQARAPSSGIWGCSRPRSTGRARSMRGASRSLTETLSTR